MSSDLKCVWFIWFNKLKPRIWTFNCETLTSFSVLLTSVCLSVQSSRLDGLRFSFSLVLIAGWLFALGGLRTTAGFSSWELSRCPGSDRGVRRRWRRLGAGFTGSPSEDGVSAGPLSVAVSSEGPPVVGAAITEPPLASFTPFSITEAQTDRKHCRSEPQRVYQRNIFSLIFYPWAAAAALFLLFLHVYSHEIVWWLSCSYFTCLVDFRLVSREQTDHILNWPHIS